MFGTTPDVAQRQDVRVVREIAEYRTAQAASELWRQGHKGLDALVKQPHLAEMLVSMKRAMMEVDEGVITVDHIYEAMRAMPAPDEDED